MPERFNLEYVGADGKKHRPVMIHRAAFGSVERFLGILLEHYGGALPVWLSPVQVIILPVSKKSLPYARKTTERLIQTGIRAELDARNEKIGWKVREAQTQKIPYMLVVGEKEAGSGTVSVRKRGAGESGESGLEKFIEMVKKEIEKKI